MNFCAEEGDVWDSTPAQDLFIQKYFTPKASPQEVVSKGKRKRKKQQASNEVSTCIQSDNKNELGLLNKKKQQNANKLLKVISKEGSLCPPIKDNSNKKKLINSETTQNKAVKSKQVKKNKLENTKKVSQILKSEKKNSSLFQNFIISPESEIIDEELSLGKVKSKNKRKLKNNEISDTHLFSESELENSSEKLQNPQKKKKKQSNKKFENKNKSLLKETKAKTKKLKQAENISDAKISLQSKSEDSDVANYSDINLQNLKKKKKSNIQIKSKSPLNDAIVQTKKLKGMKESLETDSENSEEDDNIREELQNSRTFLKIQKLMKVAPHLNPSYCGDSYDDNIDLSSYDEISSESSLSEDENSLSDENEVLMEDEESEDASENLSNYEKDLSDDNDPSSDDCEKNMEFNQISRKQETQPPDSEIHSLPTKKPNTFMEKARSKLASAKFRFLNEKLYTETGGEAYRYFQENREEFEDYHLGYRQQVAKWPLNPVDEIIKDLQKLNKDSVIADLGCGEAKIARVLTNRAVHSFDLVAKHKCVIACDFSKVPLKDCSVDVAVFCLSLMGVNLVDYLREAYRILKIGGTLKIAEVDSRIENLNIFIENLKAMGFALERQNLKHKLFVFLDLKKVKKKKSSKATTITLRPCMYKKR